MPPLPLRSLFLACGTRLLKLHEVVLRVFGVNQDRHETSLHVLWSLVQDPRPERIRLAGARVGPGSGEVIVIPRKASTSLPHFVAYRSDERHDALSMMTQPAELSYLIDDKRNRKSQDTYKKEYTQKEHVIHSYLSLHQGIYNLLKFIMMVILYTVESNLSRQLRRLGYCVEASQRMSSNRSTSVPDA